MTEKLLCGPGEGSASAASEARWTAEQVLALAPDAASRKAGGRLGAAGPWSGTGTDGTAVWGMCKGSGSKPYLTVTALPGAGEAQPAYRCSCPSRKFPCKHALGLLLLWTQGPGAVGPGKPAEFARTWLEERRARVARKAETAASPGSGSADPEAARRRRARRAARMAAGATDLEQRLADLLRGGIAGADRAGYATWEETAARMVDAQAPGLAGRVRQLASVAGGGRPGWPGRLLEECALLHLLDRGLLGADDLPAPLAATVRARAGVTTEASEVLADPGARVRDRWLVAAQRDDSEGSLTTRRIWLRGTDSGRTALLLSFGAAGRAPAQTLPPGLLLDAEVAYYPGAQPLRAVLGEQFGTPAQAGEPPAGAGVGDAVTAYGAALRGDPWLEAWPVVLSGVVPIPGAADRGWQLAEAAADGGADGDGGPALPVDPQAPRQGLWRLLAVSGGRPVTVFGECGHRGFTPLTVWGPESAGAGSAEAVAL